MPTSDLESGEPSATLHRDTIPLAQTQSREKEDQDRERALLEAAHKFNNSGRFIFKSFLETSLYVLLHLQDDIARLQEEMRQKIAQGTYTVNDREVLITSLKQYCNPTKFIT